MKKIWRKMKGGIAIVLAAALLSTSAVASGASEDTCSDGLNESHDNGAYMYDVETGETTYMPPEETEAYSDETEGFSPGYNPYADENNNENNNGDDNSIEPYYLDSGRTLVKDPQNLEWCRNTVYIEATYKNFKGETETVKGSGFMIGPNAVATAGHVVYQRQNIGKFFVGNATIIPAHNSSSNSRPYGVAHATYFYCGSGWANNEDHSDDWGIIELDSNIGNKTGWLGLRWQSASYVNTSTFVNGYPAKVNGKTNVGRDQCFRHGRINTSTKANMLESTNMYASHGDSGGPCYIYSNDTGYTAIGITSKVDPIDLSDTEWSDISSVKFRTIDKALFERMVKYRTSTL